MEFIQECKVGVTLKKSVNVIPHIKKTKKEKSYDHLIGHRKKLTKSSIYS